MRMSLPDKESGPSAGHRPSPPSNNMGPPKGPPREMSHYRAMQPPQLTDGWHWFSQVDINSRFNPTSASTSTMHMPPPPPKHQQHQQEQQIPSPAGPPGPPHQQDHQQPIYHYQSLPSYQPIMQQPVASSSATRLPGGPPKQSLTSAQPHYTYPPDINLTPQSDVQQYHQPQPRTEMYRMTGPYVTTVVGQRPWWTEAAVEGRPAYGSPSENSVC